MPYIYNSFCYSDLNGINKAIHSTPSQIQIISDTPFLYYWPHHRQIIEVVSDDSDSTLFKQFISLHKYDQNGRLYALPLYIDMRLYKCSNPGHYIEDMNITLQNPPDNFNPSNINPVDVFNSIGSGFLLVAVPLAVVWAGRHFLRPLFSK